MTETAKKARAIYADLHCAIEKANKDLASIDVEMDGEAPYLVMDWVLTVGMLRFDESGDRESRVSQFVRGGDQPEYVTRGLLDEGKDFMGCDTFGPTMLELDDE